MAKRTNSPQFGTIKQAGFTSEINVEERSKEFHRGLTLSNEALRTGVRVDYTDMSQFQRALIQKDLDNAGTGLRVEQLDFMYLPPVYKDQAIYSYYNKTTAIPDIFDASSACDTTEKLVERYAKTLGVSDLTVPAVANMEEGFKSGDSVFGKTLTSNITALHAVADGSVGILNERTLPFQAIIPTEANIGKDCMFDIIPPYTGLASAYFSHELDELQPSDFDIYTRKDYLRFMYSVGTVSDAAIKLGRSAYPSREFLSMSTLIHQLSSRMLRERRMLGVNSNIRSASFFYENANNFNYPGLYEMVTNQTATNVPVQTVLSGAGVANADAKTQYENLDKLMNDLAIRMNINNVIPNVMICDPKTFEILRNGLMKYQLQMPPVASAAFGISAIQYNLQGFQPMEVVCHPFLPRASGQCALYMLNTRLMSRRVGWTDTMDLLAKYSNLTTRFAISSAETFIDKSDIDGHSTLQGAITGITYA